MQSRINPKWARIMRENIANHVADIGHVDFSPVTVAHVLAKKWLVQEMVKSGLKPTFTQHGVGVVTIGVSGSLCPCCKRDLP